MKKSPKKSEMIISQVMLPSHSNVAGNVFGGEILKLMDSTAYAVAMKHAESNVVTARIDEIMFHKPVTIGSVVNCRGKVVFTGRTSMEVYINIEVDNIQKGRICKDALSAYFTMVAVDENDKPRVVPQLEVTDEDEKREFEKGQKRYLKRKAKNKKNKE